MRSGHRHLHDRHSLKQSMDRLRAAPGDVAVAQRWAKAEIAVASHDSLHRLLCEGRGDAPTKLGLD